MASASDIQHDATDVRCGGRPIECPGRGFPGRIGELNPPDGRYCAHRACSQDARLDVAGLRYHLQFKSSCRGNSDGHRDGRPTGSVRAGRVHRNAATCRKRTVASSTGTLPWRAGIWQRRVASECVRTHG